MLFMTFPASCFITCLSIKTRQKFFIKSYKPPRMSASEKTQMRGETIIIIISNIIGLRLVRICRVMAARRRLLTKGEAA